MSPMLLRAALRSSRRRLAVVLVLLGLTGAVAVHHGMPMDMHAMPGHSVCMAILAGAALLAVGIAVVAAGQAFARPTDRKPARAPFLPWCRSVPARAGPLHLCLTVLRL